MVIVGTYQNGLRRPISIIKLTHSEAYRTTSEMTALMIQATLSFSININSRINGHSTDDLNELLIFMLMLFY